MNRITIQAWLLVCAATLVVSDADACLTFSLQQGADSIYGRNFDWAVDVGTVIVNQRHVKKTAFVLPPERPMSWVSQYGSVTFNQFSREVPVGGMNEKGLVIESLVSTAQHPRPDTRSAINELQWIQYHLDTCKTVDDVIRSARAVRISKYAVSLHYFVSDHSGESAVIEFIQGKMVHRSANRLPTKVLANTHYDHALNTVRSKKGRFARAAQMIKQYDGKQNAKAYAFSVLDAVAQGDFTKWQVVYDISHQRIHFRTLRNRKMKIIDLSDFDFERAKDALMLDVNIAGDGNMREYFKKCTDQLNDDLMKACLKEFKKAGIMQHIKPEHIEYIRNAVRSSRQEPKRNANQAMDDD
jgi:penicillin V acylase-like amidase (Ntn superfamily)